MIIYIYAGDHDQADWLAYALGKKRDEWSYINDVFVDHIESGDVVLLWGTHFRRPGYSRTIDALLLRGATILSVSDEIMRKYRSRR